tara:strand:+ start:3726 stop:4508 length:783 start_codon:yes stop_codon:yes gene_type:complete
MKNNIYYKNSKNFKYSDIRYGFFSRNGGVSTKPFNTLNCSLSSNDKKKNIKQNVKRVLNRLDFSNHKLITGIQYHSNKVIIINNKNYNNKIYKADGFITKNKNIVLGILTADCAPIFFYDPLNQIIGAAHAGWRGCLKNICYKTIQSMKKLGSNNNNINAIIGPCINISNYEVSKDLYKKFINVNKEYKKFFVIKKSGKFFFNLEKTLKYQLKILKINKIIMVNEDTFSNHNRYFSHRRSNICNNNETGRMLNVIGFLEK